MDERTRALCYFYRHPPPGSDVKPLKYAEIAAIVRKPGQQRLKQTTIRRAVATFNSRRGSAVAKQVGAKPALPRTRSS